MLLRPLALTIQRHGYLFLAVILLATLAFRYAEPVKDSDLFFHLKYGEYMVEHNTLVPDHSIYSWTPASNDIIYCTWIGNLILYGLYQVGGLPMLFAFRYAVLLGAIGIIWWVACKMKQSKKTTTWLILSVYLLASMSGTYLKPEILSTFYIVLLAGLYFSVKSGLWVKLKGRAFLLMPLIFLAWVNTHGVFVFGLAFLFFITVGELINARVSRSNAFDRPALAYLVVAALLSVLASLLTPYGWKYLSQLAEVLYKGNAALKTVAAYLSIFDDRMLFTHASQFWIGMVVSMGIVLGYYFYQQRSVDWGLLMLNGFLCWISAQFLRTSFFWAPFWALGMIYLISRIHWPQWSFIKPIIQTTIVLGILFLSGRAIYEASLKPFMGRYLGFGIGYFNPVQESEFIKRYKPGKRMYNSYNTGSYLLWDLYPDQKVFCDARYFPYRDWYDEYYAFNNGNTPIDEFHSKYSFDYAVVDYQSSQSPILKFLRSDKWKPVFYGPVAMVFVRTDSEFLHDYRQDSPQRFDDIRNLSQARMGFYMALNLEDPSTAGHILGEMKRRFRRQYGADVILANCSRMQDGIEAYHKGEYAEALVQLEELDFEMTPKIVLTLIRLRNWQCKEYVKQGRLRAALEQLEYLLKLQPYYADALYNAGVIAFQIENQRQSEAGEVSVTVPSTLLQAANQMNEAKWRGYLKRLLAIQPDHPHARIAKQLLDGEGLSGQVPLAL